MPVKVWLTNSNRNSRAREIDFSFYYVSISLTWQLIHEKPKNNQASRVLSEVLSQAYICSINASGNADKIKADLSPLCQGVQVVDCDTTTSDVCFFSHFGYLIWNCLEQYWD